MESFDSDWSILKAYMNTEHILEIHALGFPNVFPLTASIRGTLRWESFEVV